MKGKQSIALYIYLEFVLITRRSPLSLYCASHWNKNVLLPKLPPFYNQHAESLTTLLQSIRKAKGWYTPTHIIVKENSFLEGEPHKTFSLFYNQIVFISLGGGDGRMRNGGRERKQGYHWSILKTYILTKLFPSIFGHFIFVPILKCYLW